MKITVSKEVEIPQATTFQEQSLGTKMLRDAGASDEAINLYRVEFERGYRKRVTDRVQGFVDGKIEDSDVLTNGGARATIFAFERGLTVEFTSDAFWSRDTCSVRWDADYKEAHETCSDANVHYGSGGHEQGFSSVDCATHKGLLLIIAAELAKYISTISAEIWNWDFDKNDEPKWNHDKEVASE
jgi:hypothetical protein